MTQKNIPIDELEPHSFSTELYRQDTPNRRFIEDIDADGLENPIIVCEGDEGYEIINGVRRWLAAKEMGWGEIQAVEKQYGDEAAKEEAILRNNDDREESFFQKMRVAKSYKEKVAPRLKERMEEGKSLEDMDDDPAQVFGDGENVTARGLAAGRVGWSRETFRQAEKVYDLAQEEGIEWAEKAIEAINDGDRSIHSAYKQFKEWERYRERETPVEWDDYLSAADYSSSGGMIKRCDWLFNDDDIDELVDEDASWAEQTETVYQRFVDRVKKKPGIEYVIAYRLELDGYADFGEDGPQSFQDREPEPDELWDAYWEDGLSMANLAIRYGVNQHLVRYWMWKKDVPIRYSDVPSLARGYIDVTVHEDGTQEVEVNDNTREYEEQDMEEVKEKAKSPGKPQEADAAEW